MNGFSLHIEPRSNNRTISQLTQILMKLADSVGDTVKTRNKVFVYLFNLHCHGNSIRRFGQKSKRNSTFLPLNYSKNVFFKNLRYIRDPVKSILGY